MLRARGTLLAFCLAMATPAIAADEPLRFLTGQRNVKAILVDEPEVWIGTSGGVIRYDQTADSHKVYGNKNGLLSNGIFYLGKIREQIWIGTYGGGLSLLDPAKESFRHYNVPEGLGDAFVYDVLETTTGDIWIATWSGANLISGGKMDE
ncbi:MAG: regulator, partial [Alphaproteobacteria bacterium]|nr:regulator [Alphaproteobacteria bacterium]